MRFADDVALTTNSVKVMEIQLNIQNQESNKVGHKGKTQFMTNYETSEKIEIDNIEIEKVDQYKYLGQTIATEDSTTHLLGIKTGTNKYPFATAIGLVICYNKIISGGILKVLYHCNWVIQLIINDSAVDEFS